MGCFNNIKAMKRIKQGKLLKIIKSPPCFILLEKQFILGYIIYHGRI